MKSWILCFMLALLPIVTSCQGTDSIFGRTCPNGMSPYKSGCLNNATLNLVTCMEDRGRNLSTEDKVKLEGALDTVGKVAGGKAAVEIARTVASTENPEVISAITKACIEFSKNDSSTLASEKSELEEAEEALRNQARGPGGGTPTIALTPNRGSITTPIQIVGENWPPNAELEISVAVDQYRVTSDESGNFSTTITLGDFFRGGLTNSAEIHVWPVDLLLRGRSPLMSQSALYTITN